MLKSVLLSNMKNYWILLVVFIVSIAYGVMVSVKNYYYSSYELVYWTFCGVLIFLFFHTQLYKIPIRKHQLIAVTTIAILYFISWFLIPHVARLGIFPFAMLCFLYSGTLLYDLKSPFIRVLVWGGILVSSLNILVILFFISEGSFLTRHLISTIFVSNAQETSEYLLGKTSLYHFLFLAVFIISLGLLFFNRQPSTQPVYKNRTLLLGLFCLGFILSCLSGPLGAISSEYYFYIGHKRNLTQLVENRKKGLALVDFKIDSQYNEPKKIVIIIGESLNRDFMSLYGYHKDTTPNLMKLESDSSNGKLFKFTRIISPEATTVESLQKVLTSINNENNLPFERSVSLIDLFEKAGYESFWISNQAPFGVFDTPTAAIASQADHVYFTASRDNIKNTNATSGNYYDGDLLEVFDGYISEAKPDKKQIYFIHLAGNHFFYQDRYPEEFAFFDEKEEGYTNTYLNSVRYNDWVVSNFIKIGQKYNVDLLCYFADHGEDMKYQHNKEKFKPGMVKIPFLVYLSNEYASKRKELPVALKKNRDQKGMTDDLFHDIQVMTGVKSSLFNPENSFISDQYIKKDRKVLNNSIDFD